MIKQCIFQLVALFGLPWVVLLCATCDTTALCRAQEQEIAPPPRLLWPDGAPGALGQADHDQPAVYVYSPPADRSVGAAVLICPGGGYAVLATDHEGCQIARWLQSIGVTGVVLRYRLSPYRHPIPLSDAQRGLRWIRHHATELGVSPQRIGVMGFSAGGHLASTLSTRFDAGDASSDDPIDRFSSRPDFTILGYAVISLTADFSHRGSGINLFGPDATTEQLKSLSNELQVTAETPPAFIFQTDEDPGVDAQNSLEYYRALHRAGVPAELHVYQWGPHGVGLAPADPVVGAWNERLRDWMRTTGLLADCHRIGVKGHITVDGQPLRWGMVSFTPQGPAADRLPVAWAMVSQGRFEIPAKRGAVVGENLLQVFDQGDVKPFPTLRDSRRVEGPIVAIQPSQDVLEFDL